MNEISETSGTSTLDVSEQQKLPNSSGILAMGIISLVFFSGLIGLVLAIIALSMSTKAIAEYSKEPNLYTQSSYKNVKAGKVCAIISLSLFGLTLIIVLLLAAAGAF